MNPTPISPARASRHVRNIALDVILTLITCFLYNIYVQYVQMEALNDMLGTHRYSFWSWFFLSIITCGIYHIYHEYRKSLDIATVLGERNSNEPIISVILAIFGLHIVADAIQQTHINRYYGSNAL